MQKLLLITNISSTQLKLKVLSGFFKKDLDDVISPKKNWTPNGDGTDRLYFFPGCSVPRVKVREKFTCTIKPAYGTAAFISRDGLDSSEAMFTKMRVYPTSRAALQPFMDNLSVANQHLKPMFDSLLDNGMQVGLSYQIIDTHWNQDGFGQYTLNQLYPKNIHEIRNEVLGDVNENTFYNVPRTSQLNDLNCNVYDEKEILKILNEDKVVLDDERYEEMRMYGQSGDDENITVMMELLANSHYEKSLPNICFILAEFKDKIHKKKKQKEQVNFKSLLVYLDIDPKRIDDISIGDLTHILKAKKQFTRSNAFRLSQFYAGISDQDLKQSKNQMWTKGAILKPNYIETDD